jgi:hypothetical protein
MATDDAREEIFWGEIHAHTEMSDGSGAFADFYPLAREEAALDFASASDHACYFSDNQWEWMQTVTRRANVDGRFVTLVGYEWAGAEGHRNLYTAADRLALFRGMHLPTGHIGEVYPVFAGRDDVVAGPHTVHTGDFFAGHHPDVQRFLEIYSMWGPTEEIAHEVLGGGARIGFTGGGDCHEGRAWMSVDDPEGQGASGHTFSAELRYRSGLTGAHLPALTRGALVEALRQRRTFATTSARILLDVAVAGVPMGGEGASGGPPRVEAGVLACAPLEAIRVVRDGETVHEAAVEGEDAKLDWRDEACPPGEHWYYVKVLQRDGEMAWSSPVWIERGEA